MSGTGGDGPQAVVEAIAVGTHGFHVDLSLSLLFFYVIGWAHKIVMWYFLLDRLSSHDDTNHSPSVTCELVYFV